MYAQYTIFQDVQTHIQPVASYPAATPRRVARLKFHTALKQNNPSAAREALHQLHTAIRQERGAR